MPPIILPIYAKSGTDAQRRAAILAPNEFGWSADKKALYLGDGATPGGKIASGGQYVRLAADLMNSSATALSLPVFPGAYAIDIISIVKKTDSSGQGMGVKVLGPTAIGGLLFQRALLSMTTGAASLSDSARTGTEGTDGTSNFYDNLGSYSQMATGILFGAGYGQSGIKHISGTVVFSAAGDLTLSMSSASAVTGLGAGTSMRIIPLN